MKEITALIILILICIMVHTRFFILLFFSENFQPVLDIAVKSYKSNSVYSLYISFLFIYKYNV